jgi:hypothetical protein
MGIAHPPPTDRRDANCREIQDSENFSTHAVLAQCPCRECGPARKPKQKDRQKAVSLFCSPDRTKARLRERPARRSSTEPHRSTYVGSSPPLSYNSCSIGETRRVLRRQHVFPRTIFGSLGAGIRDQLPTARQRDQVLERATSPA